MKNLHSDSIPQDILMEAKSKLDEVGALMDTYLITLTKDERISRLKMGEKSLAFVTKAHEYSKQFPELRPSFFTQEEFDIDVETATGLLPIESALKSLSSQINDTVMQAGSEAYTQALLLYNNAKLAARNNVPGAKEVYDDLRSRFPNTRRRAGEEE
ncbi:MAG: hypothetical protein MI866_18310 [Bacteroidales bacterium]|nr:hypothetical protein [Bacteroidales bacterium]